MTLIRDNLKWYKCIEWTEGASHGGAIDTGSLITSGSSENIFDNVTDTEREEGDIEYRKIFIRNENDEDYTGVHAWISQNTTEDNTDLAILAGGSKSKQGASSDTLSGTFTFSASTEVLCSTSIYSECRPGELIYNSTDDDDTYAEAIDSISADGLTITLASAYTGTAATAAEARLAPITMCTFVQPTEAASGDALHLGTIAASGSMAIWLKRTVAASGDGSNEDSFKIKVTNT